MFVYLAATGTDSTLSVDSAQPFNALAPVGVVDLVGGTFLRTDAELVDEVSALALAALGVRTIVRVDSAGDAISIRYEVFVWTF